MNQRLLIVLAALAAAPAVARAQASMQIRIDLPVVLPPMVVVSPGVRVVPDVEEEVFYSDGYYWCRRDEGWYRSRDHRRGWAFVEPRRVPPRLVGLPPGQYRKWHPDHDHDHDHGRHEGWRRAEPAPAPRPSAWDVARGGGAPPPPRGSTWDAARGRPVPAPVRDEDGDEHGNGKKKGHWKHDRD